jgi:hypothetical protein
MSDNLDNRELRRLKNSDQGMLPETVTERASRLDQRLQKSIEEAPWFQYVQDRVQYVQDREQLENDLAKPPNPGVPADAQRAHEAALLHEIAVLKQQHANDALPNQAEKRLSKL